MNYRLIPCLLLKNGGLYKSVKFKDHRYIGDPINTVKLFNDKEVDELVILDIEARKSFLGPNFALINDIVSEAFMPVAYGGGIRNMDDAVKLFKLGVEKLVFNTALFEDPELICDVISYAGSSSVVASIDAKRTMFNNYSVFTDSANVNRKIDPVEFAEALDKQGVGEILLNAVDCDGLMQGYDLNLIERVSKSVSIPVIAIGGAGAMEDFRLAINKGASAVSAASFFIFHGKHRAVLITYPGYDEIRKIITKS